MVKNKPVKILKKVEDISKWIKEDISKLFEGANIEQFRAKDTEFKERYPDALEEIFEQRQVQRKTLFKFALFWTKLLLILLILIIIAQMIVSLVSNGKIILIEKISLSILSVSILGQFIGVIIVIAKALWDDEPYKEFFKNKKRL